MSDLMARLRYYRCGDRECAEIAARAAMEIERLTASDIVARLRILPDAPPSQNRERLEAATEIERLRVENDKMSAALAYWEQWHKPPEP